MLFLRPKGLALKMIVGVLMLLPAWADAQDTFNSNATVSERANNPTLRGFDPGLIVGRGPTVPFPDTSNPIPFGRGITTAPPVFGSSTRLIDQTVDGSMIGGTVIQGSSSSIFSGPGSLSARAHQIQTSFEQSESEQDQIFNLAFSLDAMTDADGNPINVLTSADGRAVSAKGTFTQTVKDPVTTAGQTLTCTGSFTFDAVNGFVMESGPAGQCK